MAFRHRKLAPRLPSPPRMVARALVDLYTNGTVLRIGDTIELDDPVYLNTQWAFEVVDNGV